MLKIRNLIRTRVFEPYLPIIGNILASSIDNMLPIVLPILYWQHLKIRNTTLDRGIVVCFNIDKGKLWGVNGV